MMKVHEVISLLQFPDSPCILQAVKSNI